jgi:DNA-binding beta-propeller fold protein YncE
MNRRDLLTAAAALPLAAAFAPRSLAARAGGAVPLALVTADLESHVVAFDLARDRVRRRIRVQPGPRSIEAVGAGTALVAHTEHGLLSLVDAPSLRPRLVLEGVEEPRYTAAHPRRRFAYVTDSARGEVVTVDVRLGRIVHRLDVGGPARHVSVAPDGGRVWTALGSKAAHVAVLDTTRPARPRLLRTIGPPFLAHDVGFAPYGDRVWVTSGDRGAIALYTWDGGEPERVIAADAPPQHVAFDEIRRAYVASGDDGTLRVHDLLSGRLLHTARIPVGSYNVTVGWDHRVLTPSLERGTLCQLGRAGGVLATSRLARAAHDACFAVG